MDWTDRPVGRQSMIYLCRSDPSQYYMLTFKIPTVKCHHGVEVNWSRYRDTGVTDPALV